MPKSKVPYEQLGIMDPNAPDPFKGYGPNDPRLNSEGLRILRDLIKKRRGPNFRGPYEFPEDNSDLDNLGPGARRLSEEAVANTVASIDTPEMERSPAADRIYSMFGPNRGKPVPPELNDASKETFFSSPKVNPKPDVNAFAPRPSSPAAEAPTVYTEEQIMGQASPKVGRDSGARYFNDPVGLEGKAQEEFMKKLQDEYAAAAAAASPAPGEQPLTLDDGAQETPESKMLRGVAKLSQPEEEGVSFFKDPEKMKQLYKLMGGVDLAPWAAWLDSVRGKNSNLLDAFKHSSSLEAQAAQDKRQNQRLEDTAAKEYVKQINTDFKPLKDLFTTTEGIRQNLTPYQDESGKWVVNIAKAKSIVAMAARALGNVGNSTENEQTRAMATTLEILLGDWIMRATSDPKTTVGYDQVQNLMETINKIGAVTAEEVANKLQSTKETFTSIRSLSPDKAERGIAPTMKMVEAAKKKYATPVIPVQGVTAPAATDIKSLPRVGQGPAKEAKPAATGKGVKLKEYLANKRKGGG